MSTLMSTRLTFALLMLLTASLVVAQEGKPVPSDSTRLTVTGCLKGRALRAVEPREPETSGPNVAGRTFRLAGPRIVMDDVKKYNGQLVEVIGIVKKNDLAPVAPGIRVGGARVVLGAPPMSSDPLRDQARNPQGVTPVMDATSVRFLDRTCPAL